RKSTATQGAVLVDFERILTRQRLEALLDEAVSVSPQKAPVACVSGLALVHRLTGGCHACNVRRVLFFCCFRLSRSYAEQRCNKKRRKQDYREFHLALPSPRGKTAYII